MLWWSTRLKKSVQLFLNSLMFPLQQILTARLFIYLSIKIPSRIWFNNLIKLSLRCCLTTSVNSTILNLLYKSRLRILIMDKLALDTGLALTKGDFHVTAVVTQVLKDYQSLLNQVFDWIFVVEEHAGNHRNFVSY